VPEHHVSVKNIFKCYDKEDVINGIRLHLKRGECLGVLGPSGSGKSTLLYCIAGLVEPEHGGVYLNGKRISRITPKDREVGIVFQDFALFEHMSVRNNITFGLQHRGVPSDKAGERAEQLCEELNIRDKLGSRPTELSGGEQQRVALARALAMKPRLLLLDEPFSQLDHWIRGKIRPFVGRVIQERSITTVIVSHDREDVFSLADRTAVLDAGRISDIGSSVDLYESPESLVAARLSGSLVEIRAHLQGESDKPVFSTSYDHHIAADGLVSNYQEAKQYVLAFRPSEAQVISKNDSSNRGEGDLRLGSGIVERIADQGDYLEYWIRLSNAKQLRVRLSDDSVSNRGIKEEADVYISPDSLFVFDTTNST
jgi:ABC-type Fe3+/spermidine/putrescine transport system ATPase subunit